jgi:ABC-type proline/glycine betaine transport system ATPase subunit
LRCINALETYDGGSIKIDGAEVGFREPGGKRRRSESELAPIRADIGMVFQLFNLFPHLTARDNVVLGLRKVRGMNRAAARELADQWLARVGLGDKLESLPIELSGGQQQRVGVARALAADPPVLLMDEPFGAVDPIVRARLQDELVDLQSRLHKTIVFVTHDVDEAIKLGDRVVVMNIGGIVEQAAPPAELLARPASDFVRQFVGARRGLRRLSLIKVTDVDLEQRAGSTLKLHTDDTLLDALDAMLRERVTEADVTDNGTYLGTLTMDRISREVR